MKQAVVWVDWVKTVCIFLVVWGHFSAIPAQLKVFIYSVHLPAFLFVTGYLSGPMLRSAGLNQFLKGTIYYYASLYAFFTVCACALWYVLEARSEPISAILRPLMGGLGGVHGRELLLVHNDDPIWYFPFLIVSMALSYGLMKLTKPFAVVATIVVALVYLGFAPIRPLPWSLDLAPIGAIFVLLGVFFRWDESHGGQFSNRWLNSVVLYLFGATWFFLVVYNGQVNLNSRAFGHDRYVFVVAAVMGIYALVGLCRKLPASNLIKSISGNTLVMFSIHIYMTKALSKFLVRVPDGWRSIAVFAFAVLVTVITWRISIHVHPYLTKLLKPKSMYKAKTMDAEG